MFPHGPFVDRPIYTGLPRSRYGRISIDGVEVYACTESFEAAHGPILEGLVVDHICFTTKCVNIDHLRLLDRVTNMLRHPARTTTRSRPTAPRATTTTRPTPTSTTTAPLVSRLPPAEHREHKQRARAAA